MMNNTTYSDVIFFRTAVEQHFSDFRFSTLSLRLLLIYQKRDFA